MTETIVSIHQPAYLPWLGYFHKMSQSDTFVFLDSTQFEKNSFINRNKIKSANGPIWLTVPVVTKNHLERQIREIEIDNSQNWRKKHWTAIKMNYGKSEFFPQYENFFREIFETEWNKISELCFHLNSFIAKELGIKAKLANASELELGNSKKSGLLLEICKKFNASVYFSGAMGKNYLEESLFSKNGIKVAFQNYVHPEYSQLYGKFIPNLSIIDLLFNHGKEGIGILTKNQQNLK